MEHRTKGLIRIFAGFLVFLWTLSAILAMADRSWIFIGGLVSGGLIVSGVELIRSI